MSLAMAWGVVAVFMVAAVVLAGLGVRWRRNAEQQAEEILRALEEVRRKPWPC